MQPCVTGLNTGDTAKNRLLLASRWRVVNQKSVCSHHNFESSELNTLCTRVRLDQAAHLYEWEQEAHSEVGQPVDGPGDHEGSRSVGLFKQLPGQDEGDTT